MSPDLAAQAVGGWLSGPTLEPDGTDYLLTLSDVEFSDAWRTMPQETKAAMPEPMRRGYITRYNRIDLFGSSKLQRLNRATATLDGQSIENPSDDSPVEIDLAELATREPEPPSFIVPEWLPAGEVTLHAADGGTGKSLFDLRLGVCLAMGHDFYGLPVLQRCVDYVSFEDKKEIIHWRLYRICRALGIAFEALPGRLRVFDGTECLSAWYSRGEYNQTGPTAAFHDMAERIGGPGRVVIVDGASDTFAGNENDRAQVKAFIRQLRRLIAPDGALLLIAHVDKLSAKSGADSLGFSGSTGWNNGVRSRWYMYAENVEDAESGNVVIEVRKLNSGRRGSQMVLRFDEASGLFERVDSGQRDGAFQRSDEADAILTTIRAAYANGDPIPASTSGRRTAHTVCEAYDSLPASLKGRRGKTRFYKALEELRAAGAVRVESLKKANRHVAEVLNVRE